MMQVISNCSPCRLSAIYLLITDPFGCAPTLKVVRVATCMLLELRVPVLIWKNTDASE